MVIPPAKPPSDALAHGPLPADSAELLALAEQMQREIRHLRAQVAKLEEAARLERARRFGASSERGEPQYALFDEAEAHAAAEATETETDLESVDEIQVPAHTRTVARRKPLPADLPRVVVEHAPPATHCGCGAELARIGTRTSEQLDVIPAQVFVIEHHLGTYKCPCCTDAVPSATPMPAQPIPKSLAAPGLLAQVATSKYADGLPLYRQQRMFERLGIDLPRQTLASHMVRLGELVTPLVEHMSARALGHDVLQMDETRVQVLQEDGRSARSQSWMWVIRGGPPEAPVIRFHYDPGRGAQVPVRLLAGYQGYLQTDGYAGYGAVLNDSGIRGLGCWAHARRKFVEAEKALPKGQTSPRLTQILAWIRKLYALERSWTLLSPQARQERRQAESRPVIEKIEAWMEHQSVPPKSLLGKALGYLKSEWPRLTVYLEDGRLAIDNNGVENAIRPFALGRKNWLFSSTPAGAASSAALYSLVETARANGVNLYAYLKYVFTMLPTAAAPKELEALLPWNVRPDDLDAMWIKPEL